MERADGGGAPPAAEVGGELHRLLKSGRSQAAAAAALGVSRHSVVAKLKRLKRAQRGGGRPAIDWRATQSPDRGPLPPGHPETWGAISPSRWPGGQMPRL